MTRRFTTRRRSAGLVTMGLVAVGIVFVAWGSLGTDSHHPGQGALTLSAAAAELKSTQEITVTGAKPALSPSITAAQALRTAKRGMAFLGGQSPSAHLVYFTDPWYGKQTSSAVIPFSKHRLVWLVLVRHAEESPLFGSPGAPVVTYPATAAAFIDANSGKLIQILTLKDL